MDKPLDAGTFRDKLTQSFTLDCHSDDPDFHGQIKLELVECNDLIPHDYPDKARDPFSLVFKGPPGCCLPQQIHDVIHPDLGKLSIFLVPVGVAEDGDLFEAVFT